MSDDLDERVKNVEFYQVSHEDRLGQLETKLTDLSSLVGSMQTELQDFKHRTELVEKAPAGFAEHLAALEKKMKTLEGAIGSAAYKQAHGSHKK